jgi:hypothetical protein
VGYARANFVTNTIGHRTLKRGLRRRRMEVEVTGKPRYHSVVETH